MKCKRSRRFTDRIYRPTVLHHRIFSTCTHSDALILNVANRLADRSAGFPWMYPIRILLSFRNHVVLRSTYNRPHGETPLEPRPAFVPTVCGESVVVVSRARKNSCPLKWSGATTILTVTSVMEKFGPEIVIDCFLVSENPVHADGENFCSNKNFQSLISYFRIYIDWG